MSDALVDRNPALVVVLEGDPMKKIVAIDNWGAGGHVSKAWAGEPQFAHSQLTRGHDRPGVE